MLPLGIHKNTQGKETEVDNRCYVLLLDWRSITFCFAFSLTRQIQVHSLFPCLDQVWRKLHESNRNINGSELLYVPDSLRTPRTLRTGTSLWGHPRIPPLSPNQTRRAPLQKEAQLCSFCLLLCQVKGVKPFTGVLKWWYSSEKRKQLICFSSTICLLLLVLFWVILGIHITWVLWRINSDSERHSASVLLESHCDYIKRHISEWSSSSSQN